MKGDLTPLDGDGRERLLADLRAMRAARGGRLPAAALRHGARLLGASPRTVQRWLVDGTPAEPEPEGYVPDQEALILYAQYAGSVAAVHRDLTRRGLNPPPVRTLRRGFMRALGPAERAYLREGEEGWRKYQLYLRWEVDHRNQLWEWDHKELPVLVIPPGHSKGVKPWVTIAVDSAKRAIMGYALAVHRPTQAEVLNCFRVAVQVDPERGPFGGVPQVMRWDNGMEFLADSISQAAGALGECLPIPCDAYAPHQKGKVERLHRTICQEVIAGLPFWTEGPRRLDGKHYGPKVKTPGLPLEEFVELFERGVRHYNLERPHSALGGMTPLDAWEADPEPLRLASEEQLRFTFLKRERRKVIKEGISHADTKFWAPELQGLKGERVEIAYMPYDQREIQVFYQGKWLCSAEPQGQATPAQREEVLRLRQQGRQRASRLRAQASRRARVRLATMTGPGKSEPVTAITEEQAATELREAGEAALREASSLELLGIEQRVNQVKPGKAA